MSNPEVYKLKRQTTKKVVLKSGGINIIGNKTAPSLIVLIGSIDWLTTVVGIVYFGAVEANPFLAELASSNLAVFSVIKLGTAIFVGFLFYQAEITLSRIENRESKGFIRTRCILKGAYLISLIFLVIVVANNVLTVLGRIP